MELNNIDSNKELVFKQNKVILVGLLFLIVFYSIMAIGYITDTNASTGGLIFAWALIVIGGYLAFWFLLNLIRDQPLLIVNAEGLSSDKIGIIPWNNIDQLRLVWSTNARGARIHGALDIHLKKQTNNVRRSRFFFPKILVLKNGQLIRISLFFSPIGPDKLLNILRAYFQAHTADITSPEQNSNL